MVLDTVIHSAGVVSFIKRDREQMYRVNVEGTGNVVNIALEKCQTVNLYQFRCCIGTNCKRWLRQ